MLDYIIKVLLFQTLFLAVYDLLLKRETFFQWNRGYLILTSIVAYIIPLLRIDRIDDIIPQKYIVYLPEVILSPSTVIEEKFDWSALLFTSLKWIFWIGLLIATVLFLIKLYRLIQLIYTNEKENNGIYQIVFLSDKKAFSFFQFIFLGKDIKQENKQQIIEHELVHVRQKHSIDLLLFELQKIVFWFNPFSYLFQHRIAELHEFIADSKAIKVSDKSIYFQNLLAQAFQVQKISFINPFFKVSLIKKRIIMLNKNKSKQVLKLKYLLLVPVLLSMLVYSSCEKKHDAPIVIKKNEKRMMTIYFGDGVKVDKKEIKSKIESYFDAYAQGAKPSSGKEISYFKLTTEEKEDFQRFRKPPLGIEEEKLISEYKIYQLEDGSKAIMEHGMKLFNKGGAP